MLVLSRRLHQRILFPGLNISVQVVEVRSGTVRLGIEAPAEVSVLREEVPDRRAEWGPEVAPENNLSEEEQMNKLNQRLRNRLRMAAADLRLLRKQLQMRFLDDAEETLDKMQQDLREVFHPTA